MKITMDDIQIIDNPQPQKKEEPSNDECEYYPIVHWDSVTNYTYWSYKKKTDERPVVDGDAKIYALKKCKFNQLWNEETRTGIAPYYTEDYVRSLVLLHGVPEFPIKIGNDGLLVLKKVYENMQIITSVEDYKKYYENGNDV